MQSQGHRRKTIPGEKARHRLFSIYHAFRKTRHYQQLFFLQSHTCLSSQNLPVLQPRCFLPLSLRCFLTLFLRYFLALSLQCFPSLPRLYLPAHLSRYLPAHPPRYFLSLQQLCQSRHFSRHHNLQRPRPQAHFLQMHRQRSYQIRIQPSLRSYHLTDDLQLPRTCHLTLPLQVCRTGDLLSHHHTHILKNRHLHDHIWQNPTHRPLLRTCQHPRCPIRQPCLRTCRQQALQPRTHSCPQQALQPRTHSCPQSALQPRTHSCPQSALQLILQPNTYNHHQAALHQALLQSHLHTALLQTALLQTLLQHPILRLPQSPGDLILQDQHRRFQEHNPLRSYPLNNPLL